jgi:hypothetical protein
MSGAKLCAAAFIGPKTRTILSNTNFEIERRSWTSFRLVVNNFLGSNKAANYQQSIKVLFLHSHLHFSPDNLGDVSNKHSERFHRDVAPRSNSITAEWTPLWLGIVVGSLWGKQTISTMKKRSLCSTLPLLLTPIFDTSGGILHIFVWMWMMHACAFFVFSCYSTTNTIV